MLEMEDDAAIEVYRDQEGGGSFCHWSSFQLPRAETWKPTHDPIFHFQPFLALYHRLMHNFAWERFLIEYETSFRTSFKNRIGQSVSFVVIDLFASC
jgi:hypothetical protein